MNDVKVRPRYDKGWVRCGRCGHKLAQVVGAGYCSPSPILEIKCHSCKTTNTWWYEPSQGDEKYEI